ncbi:MAG: helix-turn-helix domain-containing protein [Solirubrobacterales bacterium]
MRAKANNHALIKALSHPLRRQILRTMSDGQAASPRELAERLDQPLSNLSYHVRVLVNSGALKLVRKQQVRGTMQHFYRPSVKAKWVQALLKEADRGAPEGVS